jgi:hypothetical protein
MPAAGLALVGGVGLAVLGLGLLRPDPARVTEGCSIESERMTELWNDERRRELGSTLRGIDAPIADETAEHVLTALDLHAAAWTFQANQLCEAESETAMIDPSHHFLLACFSQSLSQTEGAIEALAGLDRDSITRAMDVVREELLPPEQCYSRGDWGGAFDRAPQPIGPEAGRLARRQ